MHYGARAQQKDFFGHYMEGVHPPAMAQAASTHLPATTTMTIPEV